MSDDKFDPKTISCIDGRATNCEKEFEFGTRDQEFFAKHGWKDPVRCRPCRQEKKRAQAES